VVEVEAEAAAAPGEPMDINTAVHMVLKKSLAHDGLSRGLHEATRAIERGEAQLCILADDCNSPDYKKLIEALCAEHNVNLISVPENKQLGQMAGVSAAAGRPARPQLPPRLHPLARR
jgi:small subunit ribosomal protein S12e